MTRARFHRITWLAVLLIPAAFAHSQTSRADVPAAIDHFRNNQPGAFEEVVAAGEPAFTGVAEMLADKKLTSVQRFMAANALGDIGSPKGVKPLLAAINDDDFNVRRCAALALGKLGDPATRGPLEKRAKDDPFAWKDPASGEVHYLVREDARRALEFFGKNPPAPGAAAMQKEPEVFLDDASKRPPLKTSTNVARLPWPFPGKFAEQNIWNNYQQPTDIYIHGGLDMLQPPGTEVRAVDGGYVAAIYTNYPNWKTHHFFVVAREKNGNEGWCYTHVAPDSYTFKVGDQVKQGQVLGKTVEFYVGKNKGADHLHLNYIRFSKNAAGGVEVESLLDPLLFFDAPDTSAPQVHAPLHFVRKGSLDELATAGNDKLVTVSGNVEIIAGISDNAYEGHAGNWMAPTITLEITGNGIKPWRKLVLDQRGPLPIKMSPLALYLSNAEAQRWTKDAPRFPTIFYAKVTSSDGNGIIQPADTLQSWDTAELDTQGKRRFPDGSYTITVRAWDLAGNPASRTENVRVANGR